MAEVNGVIMQYFHWYIDPNLILWNQVASKAQELAEADFTALWVPPAYKGIGGIYDVGYGVYDMYDLGEFDQKGTVRTKYGDRQQYLDAIEALHNVGIQVYADAVLNHRMGAEGTEVIKATPFSPNDRLHPRGEMREIKAYTHFQFPGRQKQYSDFEWHWWHFDAVDYDDYTKEENSIYLFERTRFDDFVALENGNYAYQMGCDIDFQSKEVRDEVMRWSKWYLKTTGVDGFCLDEIKHISSWFFPLWIDVLEHHFQKDLFMVGEYWYNDISTLHRYINSVAGKMSVFDVPLHYNFYYASKSGGHYDMRYLLKGTLIQERPINAVTFVENHNSQPLQPLETPVEPWFKPLAYAIILLRREGYPCVFYADYYGAEYEDYGKGGNRYKIFLPSHRWIIDKFLFARKYYAHGEQYDYFDHYNIVGWTRLGDGEHPKTMAVIMSDSVPGYKLMDVGKPNTKFYDLTENIHRTIYTNESGWAEFCCNGGSVSVWLEE